MDTDIKVIIQLDLPLYYKPLQAEFIIPKNTTRIFKMYLGFPSYLINDDSTINGDTKQLHGFNAPVTINE